MKQFNPPHRIKNKLLVFIGLCLLAYTGHSQSHDLPQAQRIPVKTYFSGQTEFRANDNVIVSIREMNVQTTGNTFEERALHYLEKNKEKLGISGDLSAKIKHYFTWEGQGTTVVRFQQVYQNLPVDNNEIVIIFNHTKRIVSLSNSCRPIKNAIKSTGGFIHDNDANNTDLQSQLISVTFPIGDQFASSPTPLRGERAYDNVAFCLSPRQTAHTIARNHLSKRKSRRKSSIILEKPPAINPGMANGTVFIRQTESTAATTQIRITTPAIGRNISCESQGDLRIRLGGNLHTLWQNGGSLVTGATLESDGRLRLTEANASLTGLALTPGVSYFLEVFYEPDQDARRCLFDLAQFNYLNQETGGERFEYNPEKWESSEGRNAHRSVIGSLQEKIVSLKVFPVPASDQIKVQINANEDIADASLIVYDSYGRLQLQRSVAVRKEGSSVVLEVTSLSPGLYFLEIQDNEGRKLSGSRFSKL